VPFNDLEGHNQNQAADLIEFQVEEIIGVDKCHSKQCAILLLPHIVCYG
jgi:hypothetical protein